MADEGIIWKGRQSLWSAPGAIALLLTGIVLLLIGIPLLPTAYIIVLLGVFLLACSGYLFKGLRTYIITNRRLVEIRRGKIEREVSLDEIIEECEESELVKFIDGIADLTLMFLGRGGGLPRLLGIGSLHIRSKEGKIIFIFRGVKVKIVKNKLAEAMKEAYRK